MSAVRPNGPARPEGLARPGLARPKRPAGAPSSTSSPTIQLSLSSYWPFFTIYFYWGPKRETIVIALGKLKMILIQIHQP